MKSISANLHRRNQDLQDFTICMDRLLVLAPFSVNFAIARNIVGATLVVVLLPQNERTIRNFTVIIHSFRQRKDPYFSNIME
ncbi:MAG: hypothetical protein ACOYOA_10510 [Saprospiraceae bacterium]